MASEFEPYTCPVCGKQHLYPTKVVGFRGSRCLFINAVCLNCHEEIFLKDSNYYQYIINKTED